jgi:putative ABC transport system ATP-binding protein
VRDNGSSGKGEIMIKMRSIEKSYPVGAGRSWVLRRVDLDIREGEFLTIMGPSGAGKSSLMAILGMLDGDWKGEFFLYENAVHKLKNQQRVELHKRYVGFVFQQYHLLDNLTVAENLDLPLSYRDLKKPERQSIVADVLDRFQIVGKKDLYPSQLSGGQQQLVAVARAVIGNPKLVLADEPTGSLHSSQGKMIMDLLKGLNDQGTTIVQVTHNENWAAYGDRIIQLLDGWVANSDEKKAVTSGS